MTYLVRADDPVFLVGTTFLNTRSNASPPRHILRHARSFGNASTMSSCLALVCPISIPSLRSSPWIRGAPQSAEYAQRLIAAGITASILARCMASSWPVGSFRGPRRFGEDRERDSGGFRSHVVKE